MSFDAGAVVGKLEMSLEGWKKSVSTVEKDQQSMSGFAMRHKDEIQKLGKEFVVAGAAITGALMAATICAANAGDAFDEMADKTGVSVETLSTLKLAGDKAGSSIESIAMGMKFLGAQMIETSTATDKGKTLLGALGIAATDAAGQIRPVNDVLFEVADKFKGMENGAIKTKLAVGLFGKAGMDLIPVLNMGKQGLMESEEAAKKLGLEWSGPAAKAASNFADSLVDLKAAGEGLGKTIGETLMPMIQGIVEKVISVVTSIREWASAHPELTKALSSLAFVIGGVLTIVGSLIFVIPTLVTHFAAFAAILGTTSAALALSLGGLTAIAAAAVFAYNTINNLTKATNYATDAAGRVDRAYTNTGKKLREVADACGLTRAEYVKLQDKYQNVTAMEIAIRKGQEGVEMQKALAKYGKEHGAVLDDQAKKSGAFSTELDKLLANMGKGATATKTLKDELGLVFNADLQVRIALIQKALEDYKGQLSTESEKKLREELAKLQANFETAVGPARDLKGVLEKAGTTMEQTGFYTHDLDGEIEKLADQMGMSIATVKMMAYEIMRLNLQLMGITMPDLRIPEAPVKANLQQVTSAFDGAFADLSKSFGDTFSSFVETWSWDKIINGKVNFKSFFADIWKNIKETFFRLLGDMAAKWAKTMLTDLITPTKEVGKSLIENVGGAMTSVGTTVTTVTTSIGSIITTLASAVATAIGSLATGIASAIVTIATAVASAATILAAAISALIVIGVYALVLYAAFKIVGGVIDALFGGGGKASDVTYWLKFIKDLNQEMHDMMRNMVDIMIYEQGQGDEMWWYANALNGLVQATNTILSDISAGVWKVVEGLANVPQAATGAVFQKPSLTWIAEKGPEAAIPLAKTGGVPQALNIGDLGGGGSGTRATSVNLTANFQIVTPDGGGMRNIVREKIGPELITWLKTNFGKDQLRFALGI